MLSQIRLVLLALWLFPLCAAVSVTASNGTYKTGESVDITVTWDVAVTVTNPSSCTLTIALDNDQTATAPLLSGDGTSTFIFRYTVSAGHTSSDLDYASNSAISEDPVTVSGNTPVSLPLPGETGSLSANQAIVIDGIRPTILSVFADPNPSMIQKAGDNLFIHLLCSEPVYVNGNTARLALELGQAAGSSATATTQSDVTEIVFSYTITEDDLSSDLQYTSINALTLNGATIRDAAGNDLVLTLPSLNSAHSLGGSSSVVVDAQAPFIERISAPGGSYVAGDIIPITVTFSENVYFTGSTRPELTLQLDGAGTVVLSNLTRSGKTLTFIYEVGDNDKAIQLATSGTLGNNTSVVDLAQNTASSVLPSALDKTLAGQSIEILGAVPSITSVGTTAPDGRINTAETLAIQVTFNETITVTGSPRLLLDLDGSATALAPYTSGSGSNTLIFTYTVGASDRANRLGVTSLSLNGGSLVDSDNNNAILTLPTTSSATLSGAHAISVNTDPIDIARVASVTAENGWYALGDLIAIKVRWNTAVTLSGSSHRLTLLLDSGDDIDVAYSSGSGTDTLIFNYLVGQNHRAQDLQYFGTGALIGSFLHAGNNSQANTSLPATSSAFSLAGSSDVRVDGNPPQITSVSGTNGTYYSGQTIAITVTCSEDVTITPPESSGTAIELALALGSTSGKAQLQTTGSKSTLVFTYVVQPGDSSSDLECLNTAALLLNGGSLVDVAGNPLEIVVPIGSSSSLARTSNIIVDGNSPVITKVSTSNDNGTYKLNDTITISLTCSKAITISGSASNLPSLTLNAGSTAKAVFESGSGTNNLTFRYQVQDGEGTDDLDITAVALNGGSLRDSGGNNLILALPTPSLAAQANLKIVTGSIPVEAGETYIPAELNDLVLRANWTSQLRWNGQTGASLGELRIEDLGGRGVPITGSASGPDGAGVVTLRLSLSGGLATFAGSHIWCKIVLPITNNGVTKTYRLPLLLTVPPAQGDS